MYIIYLNIYKYIGLYIYIWQCFYFTLVFLFVSFSVRVSNTRWNKKNSFLYVQQITTQFYKLQVHLLVLFRSQIFQVCARFEVPTAVFIKDLGLPARDAVSLGQRYRTFRVNASSFKSWAAK